MVQEYVPKMMYDVPAIEVSMILIETSCPTSLQKSTDANTLTLD